jgi:hypothetical protein
MGTEPLPGTEPRLPILAVSERHPPSRRSSTHFYSTGWYSVLYTGTDKNTIFEKGPAQQHYLVRIWMQWDQPNPKVAGSNPAPATNWPWSVD